MFATRLLGRRTAELHHALAGVEGADFRPEPFTSLYQRSLYQAMLSQSEKIGIFGHGYTYTAHPVGCAVGSDWIVSS